MSLKQELVRKCKEGPQDEVVHRQPSGATANQKETIHRVYSTAGWRRPGPAVGAAAAGAVAAAAEGGGDAPRRSLRPLLRHRVDFPELELALRSLMRQVRVGTRYQDALMRVRVCVCGDGSSA